MGLILARKVGGKIVIPKYGIEIVVIEVVGRHVKLLFEAPADVVIHRSEIQERIDKEAAVERSGAA